MWRFEVKDEGIGIASEQRDRIFTKFAQAESSTTRRFGGTGLGLAICAQLVELMGGRIGVDSELERGSTFWFELPLAPCVGGTLSLPPRAEGECFVDARFNASVLVVDDNRINRRVLQRILEGIGCRVTLAVDGVEGVDLARTNAFDIILMDCQMPRMDGFEATGILRREQGLGLPIIAITASALEQDRGRCREAGMDGFLLKPIDVHALRSALGQWLPADRVG